MKGGLKSLKLPPFRRLFFSAECKSYGKFQQSTSIYLGILAVVCYCKSHYTSALVSTVGHWH